MPALIPTDPPARVVWLGYQPVPVEKLVITSAAAGGDAAEFRRVRGRGSCRGDAALMQPGD